MRRGSVENTCSIDMRVSLKRGMVKESSSPLEREKYDTQAALNELVDTLRALGLVVDRDKSQLHIEFPSASNAKRLRSRGGGRPKTKGETPDITKMEDGDEKDLACEWQQARSYTDRVAYFEKHGAAATARAMGVSVSTVYRRVPEWRHGKRIEELQAEYMKLPIDPIDERLAFLKKQSGNDIISLVPGSGIIPNSSVARSWPHNPDCVEVVRIWLNAEAERQRTSEHADEQSQ